MRGISPWSLLQSHLGFLLCLPLVMDFSLWAEIRSSLSKVFWSVFYHNNRKVRSVLSSRTTREAAQCRENRILLRQQGEIWTAPRKPKGTLENTTTVPFFLALDCSTPSCSNTRVVDAFPSVGPDALSIHVHSDLSRPPLLRAHGSTEHHGIVIFRF